MHLLSDRIDPDTFAPGVPRALQPDSQRAAFEAARCCTILILFRCLYPERFMNIKMAAAALIPFATILVLNSTVHAQPPTKSIWDGVFSEAQATRGKALYSENCASCHGGELTGGEMAPPLAGGEFMAGWDGLTIGDLFERIRISMPQNAPGSLSGQQNADILAFMFSANKFPAGETELPKEAGILKQIKFEVKKP
jgi:quinoprotein glucose dehydrogenase